MIERPYFLRIVQIMTEVIEELPYKVSKYMKRYNIVIINIYIFL